MLYHVDGVKSFIETVPISLADKLFVLELVLDTWEIDVGPLAVSCRAMQYALPGIESETLRLTDDDEAFTDTIVTFGSRGGAKRATSTLAKVWFVNANPLHVEHGENILIAGMEFVVQLTHTAKLEQDKMEIVPMLSHCRSVISWLNNTES